MSDMKMTIRLIENNIQLRIKESNIRINNYQKEINYYRGQKYMDNITEDHVKDLELSVEHCEIAIDAYDDILKILS